MWLTVLLQFLVPLLAKFIEAWLTSNGIKSDLSIGKDAWNEVLKRRGKIFGQRRFEVGLALYDKAASKHEEWKATPFVINSAMNNVEAYSVDLAELTGRLYKH